MDLYETLKIFLMAVTQGIGEFLPISSSGHLLVLGTLLFGSAGALGDGGFLALGVLLHAGTLLSILIVFRRRIVETLTVNRRLIWLLVVGSIPTAAIGFFIERKMMFLAENLTVTGIGFFVTGFLLLAFLRDKPSQTPELIGGKSDGGESTDEPAAKEEKTLQTIGVLDALWVGVIQGIAVLPGFSRSGLTITAGRMRGMRREDAAVFSFFLAIPAIGGVALLETIKLIRDADSTSATPYALYIFGAAVSFIVGIVSLVWLMKWLERGKLYRFAWWLFPLGTAVLLWQILGS